MGIDGGDQADIEIFGLCLGDSGEDNSLISERQNA